MTRHLNISTCMQGVIALVLACLVLCFGAANAFALSNPDLDRTDCSLTFKLETTDGGAAAGVTMGIVRVAQGEVTSTGYDYVLTDDFAATGADLSTIGDTSSDLANAAIFVGYADQQGIDYTSAVSDADGTVRFTGLPCGLYAVTMLDAPVGYELSSPFLVTLPQGSLDDGWTYDVVADQKPFAITYQPPEDDDSYAHVDPPVKKTVVGDEPKVKGTFTFTMTADDPSSPMPAGSEDGSKSITVKGAGTYEFGQIVYRKAGTYTYTVVEEELDEAGYSYDGSEYHVTHTVTEGKDGSLSAKTTIERDGSQVDVIAFENAYDGSGRLPQTGQFWQPVIALVFAGLLLFGAGLYRSRRQDADEAFRR